MSPLRPARSCSPASPLLTLAALFSAALLPTSRAQGAQGTGAVGDLNRAVQGALGQCGLKLSASGPLSRAAAGLAGGAPSAEALRDQGYRADRAWGLTLTYHGDLAWVGRQVQGRCRELRDYTEYGVAANGTQGALMFARPARVDLSRRWQEDFLAATNRARFQGQKCGGTLMNAVPALKWDAALEAAAARHVHDMITLNFRGHVHPLDQSRPQNRAARAGFVGVAGENIAYGPLSAQDAVAQLLLSPEHCKNLMNPNWTRFGGAVGNGSVKTIFATYWVQVFGRPR